jgi:hypothetical protein
MAAKKAKSPRKARVIVKARLGRKPPPPNESKRDRFCRIGERRMNEVIGKIALLGNLSGPQYECTHDDLERMKSTIQIALDGAMSRFGRTVRQQATGFSFTDNRSPSLAPRLNAHVE